MPRRKRVKDAPEATNSDTISALRDSPGEIVDCFVVRLCDLVGLGATLSKRVMYQRNVIVSLLNNLPILNKALAELIRQDPRYAPIMFYERHRLGAGASGHFLEALPRGLSLFGSFQFSGISDQQLQASLMAISKERTATIEQIERSKEAPPLPAGATDITSDIPASVPWRARRFLAVQRSYALRLRNSKPAHFFCQCPNKTCRRLVYCGPVRNEPSAGDEPVYWNTLDSGNDGLKVHPAQFCSWFCRQSHEREVCVLRGLMPVEKLDADVGCRKEQRHRVAEALRLCARRNEQLSRTMRELESNTHFLSINPKPFFTTLKRRLNIDLGLLYASSIMAESRALSNGRVLAGTHEGWRTRPVFYMKAIRKLGALYEKYHTGGNVISNLLIDEPFLRKVKAKCLEIF